MPRRARGLQEGDYYHVLNRGSVRARIFHNRPDYAAFVALLDETVRRFGLPLVSYCVMPNHWHLVVQPLNLDQLSTSMHWLTCTHAIRWCRAHERAGPGPLYQGRFKSIPVQPDIHLVRVCRYVERNALSAKLVNRAEEWPWSSVNQRCENRPSPALAQLQFLMDTEWIRTVNKYSIDVPVAKAIRQNRPFGSDPWARLRIERMGLGESGERGRPKGKNKPVPIIARRSPPPLVR
jgi:putative transposase